MSKNVNKITKYQTSDMREFEDRDAAIKWEVQLELIKIMNFDLESDLLLLDVTKTMIENKDAIIAALKDL